MKSSQVLYQICNLHIKDYIDSFHVLQLLHVLFFDISYAEHTIVMYGKGHDDVEQL